MEPAASHNDMPRGNPNEPNQKAAHEERPQNSLPRRCTKVMLRESSATLQEPASHCKCCLDPARDVLNHNSRLCWSCAECHAEQIVASGCLDVHFKGPIGYCLINTA